MGSAISYSKPLQNALWPASVPLTRSAGPASIGLSVSPDDGEDGETLIKNADTAMYQAKEGGRQGYRFFEPQMNVRAVERQFIEEGLRGALQGHEFLLHYQPI